MNRVVSGGDEWGSDRTIRGKNDSSSVTVYFYSNSSHLSVQMSLIREATNDEYRNELRGQAPMAINWGGEQQW